VAAHETRATSDAFTGHSQDYRACLSDDRSTDSARGPDCCCVVQDRDRAPRGVGPGDCAKLRPCIERVLAVSPKDPSVRGVLDYGCGRGADVNYFRSLGLDVCGYDPHAPFGFAESPTGLFMVVTLIFVLNVLRTVEARLEVMCGAAARLAPEGALIVATRSTATIRREAARNGWRAWGDGFVSDERRCTFQHGMDAEEIAGLGEMLGLRSQPPLPTVRDASLVALARRTPTIGPV
jgi:Methyltransferase domain